MPARKIAVIVGSLRKDSYNRRMAHAQYLKTFVQAFAA